MEGMRSDLQEIERLLEKISHQAKPAGLEVNWDGKQFLWKFRPQNMTADEWQPKETREQSLRIIDSRGNTEH